MAILILHFIEIYTQNFQCTVYSTLNIFVCIVYMSVWLSQLACTRYMYLRTITIMLIYKPCFKTLLGPNFLCLLDFDPNNPKQFVLFFHLWHVHWLVWHTPTDIHTWVLFMLLLNIVHSTYTSNFFFTNQSTFLVPQISQLIQQLHR